MDIQRPPHSEPTPDLPAPRHSMLPLAFSNSHSSPGTAPYINDPATRALLHFFEAKGLARLKEEDRLELFAEDWIAYQSSNSLYASLLTPAEFSLTGGQFDLLRYARFLEVFAYCSPAHGYSLQVTFLGFFSLMMGSNLSLKHEAAASLSAGHLFAFGVAERDHGSDLLAGEFSFANHPAGGHTAQGNKYYIGNADHASLIVTLGRHSNGHPPAARDHFMLVALRPQKIPGFRSLGKIHTLGVRAANVGAFEVRNYRFPPTDIVAQNRNTWDAVFGTVTLGKFFLGFGSIGICEHAYHEALAHLQSRTLYGKPAIDMPHLRAAMNLVHARLTAMKLYAYRALDYLHAASPADRRYLLFCAVQKVKVSTEGIKIMALLSECIGAKGFEADTYFEMALRDASLIPGLEGSMHVNLTMAAPFLARYFARSKSPVPLPPSLIAGQTPSRENPFLTQTRTGGVHSIAFRPFLEPYRSLIHLPNVPLFTRQAAAFRHFIHHTRKERTDRADTQMTLGLSQCLSTIAYGQLIAESASQLELPAKLISLIFGLLVDDLSYEALRLASLPGMDAVSRRAITRMIKAPQPRS